MLYVDWATAGIIFTTVTTIASLTWWLSGQFAAIRTMVHERVGLTERALVDKIEYHEKHDDKRFEQMRADISEIRIRNAAKDTLMSSVLNRLEELINANARKV